MIVNFIAYLEVVVIGVYLYFFAYQMEFTGKALWFVLISATVFVAVGITVLAKIVRKELRRGWYE